MGVFFLFYSNICFVWHFRKLITIARATLNVLNSKLQKCHRQLCRETSFIWVVSIKKKQKIYFSREKKIWLWLWLFNLQDQGCRVNNNWRVNPSGKGFIFSCKRTRKGRKMIEIAQEGYASGFVYLWRKVYFTSSIWCISRYI